MSLGSEDGLDGEESDAERPNEDGWGATCVRAIGTHLVSRSRYARASVCRDRAIWVRGGVSAPPRSSKPLELIGNRRALGHDVQLSVPGTCHS